MHPTRHIQATDCAEPQIRDIPASAISPTTGPEIVFPPTPPFNDLTMFGRYTLLFLLYITLPFQPNTVTMLDINALIKTVPQLLDPSISIKLVEVAKKYGGLQVRLI
jgi:hypothetical protein